MGITISLQFYQNLLSQFFYTNIIYKMIPIFTCILIANEVECLLKYLLAIQFSIFHFCELSAPLAIFY